MVDATIPQVHDASSRSPVRIGPQARRSEQVPDSALIKHHVAGKSPLRIAEALGLTPGQVSGRLFRLRHRGQLPAREVQPPRGGPGFAQSLDAEAHRRQRIAQTKTRKVAPSPPPEAVRPPVAVQQPPAVVQRQPVVVQPSAVMPPPPAREPMPSPVTLAPRPISACCWPIGEPGTRSFRFCTAEAVSGRPYCSDHMQKAYWRPRRTDEAYAA